MTLTVDNAKKMLFTLRYPPDKIVNIYPGSFTAVASSTPLRAFRTEDVIAHTFGTTLFLDMTWSEDGGTTWQPANSGVPNLSNPSNPVFQTRMVGCYSTNSSIVVTCSNYSTASKTIMYNVAAFWKD